MATDHIRASDHDRDAVVETLRDAFSEGRLTLDEFQERTTAAYAGRTWGDLRQLTTDLPVQPPLGADIPVPSWHPGMHPEVDGVPHPLGALLHDETQPYPGTPPLPGAPPYPGAPPLPDALSGAPSQPPTGLPPHPSRPPGGSMPPSGRPRGRLGPVLPVMGMWILFALATRSIGGAVVFCIAVVVIVTLASHGHKR
jgi:hypothetical protein